LQKTSLRQLCHLDMEDYSDEVAYIGINPDLETWRRMSRNTLEANLLKPGVWDAAINEAGSLFASRGLGTMVVASALNLLFLSPTYRKLNVEELESLLKWYTKRTYLSSVSISPFRDDVEGSEKAADRRMLAGMERPMKLYLKNGKNRKQRASFQGNASAGRVKNTRGDERNS
jgi:hypothetical protein